MLSRRGKDKLHENAKAEFGFVVLGCGHNSRWLRCRFLSGEFARRECSDQTSGTKYLKAAYRAE
jgi:hypothetical protein